MTSRKSETVSARGDKADKSAAALKIRVPRRQSLGAGLHDDRRKFDAIEVEREDAFHDPGIADPEIKYPLLKPNLLDGDLLNPGRHISRHEHAGRVGAQDGAGTAHLHSRTSQRRAYLTVDDLASKGDLGRGREGNHGQAEGSEECSRMDLGTENHFH